MSTKIGKVVKPRKPGFCLAFAQRICFGAVLRYLSIISTPGCFVFDATGFLDPDEDGSPWPEDCDSTNATVAPTASEVPYNGVDDDCNPATVDDDLDGDGWPQADGDCDDKNPNIHPAQTDDEDAHGLDTNCDGLDGEDLDGDGFAGNVQGDVADCVDSDAAIYPGADESCDEMDNDCDGEVDEDAVDAKVWYVDMDGDGHGVSGDEVYSCDQPSGRSFNNEDCADDDGTTYPGATETCGDDTVNDCDGTEIEAELDCQALGSVEPTQLIQLWGGERAGGYVTLVGDIDGDTRRDAAFGYGVGVGILVGKDIDRTQWMSGTVNGPFGTCSQPNLVGDLDGDNEAEVAVSCDSDLYLFMNFPSTSESVRISSQETTALSADMSETLDGIHDLLVRTEYPIGTSYSVFYSPITDKSPSAESDYSDRIFNNGEIDGRGWVATFVNDEANGGTPSLVVGIGGDNQAGVSSGSVYVLPHPQVDAIIELDSTTRVHGAEHENLGADVAGGHLNADGYPDLLIGAPYEGSLQSGGAYILYGQAGETTSLVDAVYLAGEMEGDYAGFTVEIAGDVNDDGELDLAVGAPSAGDVGGRVYILFGPVPADAVTIDLIDSDVVIQNNDGDYGPLGQHIAGGENFDGQPGDDLLIGSPNAYINGSSAQGMVILYSVSGLGL